ncbi:MAG TPA: hypothetical protein VMD03_09220 [Steroidobacteraceae bacterium]|nr:hypothetical protein [Steroidobacteraceae bacterium]
MNTGRFAAPGKTRSCPHCKATILESATVCPGCHHHLRFDSASTGQRPQPLLTPLRVEGTLRHPSSGGALEYSVVLTIRDRRGQEIARQVVGVGALQPAEERTFTLAVEVFRPVEIRETKPQTAAAAPPRAPEVRVPPRPPAPPLSPGPAREAPRPTVAAPEARPTAQAPSPRPTVAAPGASRPLPPVNGAVRAQPRNAGFKDPRLSTTDPKSQPKRS